MSKHPYPLRQNNPTLRALALAIDASGLRQADLARLAGVNQAVISFIRGSVTGKGVGYVSIESVAQALGYQLKLVKEPSNEDRMEGPKLVPNNKGMDY